MIFYVKFPKWFPYVGITLWPFILIDSSVKEKPAQAQEALIRHERIHLAQQLELLLVGFYILYIFEFIAGLLVYNVIDTAYREISFEKEAYCNQGDENYLASRPLFAWVRYLFV